MPDDVIPQLARKETIPLPFVEPGDDLLRVGEEPPSPTDYCVALLRDGKLRQLILPSNGVPLTMCASFQQVNLNNKGRGLEGMRSVQQITQMESTVRPRGLSRSLETTLKSNTKDHIKHGRQEKPNQREGSNEVL